jgi:hypothetical protein
METNYIDTLFLELSQFTQAKTENELKLQDQNKKLIGLLPGMVSKNAIVEHVYCIGEGEL